MMRKLLLTAVLLLAAQGLFAQMFPERRDVRRGNKEYERENYVESEAAYMGALSKNPASYEGNFNLGNSYYRQGRFEEAAQRFQQTGQIPNMPGVMAQTWYNYGNALVQQYKQGWDRKKLEEALEVYKQSLRLNPTDQEAKFNLAYVQKLLEQENGGGGGGGNDQNNQNNQNNQNDQNNQGDGQDDPNQGDGQNDQNPDQNGDQDPKEGDQNPDQSNDGQQDREGQSGQEPRMSREEAEQMLNAMQNKEEGAREEMEGEPVGVVGRSGKNW